MKLLAGIALFLLCAMVGEERARALQRRARDLSALCELIRTIGDRQLNSLVSFREAALSCPASPEREALLELLGGREPGRMQLTLEERARLSSYTRSESRSVEALQKERDDLLALLQRDRDLTREELAHKGRVCRSVGYLCGAAALLLVL